MSQLSQEKQTVRRPFGMKLTNIVLAGALAVCGGYLFESILLGIGLYFCFGILFDEVSYAAERQKSSDIHESEDFLKPELLNEEVRLPANPRQFSWIRRDDRYYIPSKRTPGRISYAEFSLATRDKGPMGFFES